ncbi:MAG: hypothetical protein LBN29_02545 [Mediterranea sp.]|jgi:hypothetical protein|nr:hypothetical protein [Mediterranea sp.]
MKTNRSIYPIKRKNRIPVLFAALLIACASSCNDNSPDADNPPPNEERPFAPDKELVYLYQTNKDMIVYSLIRYDYEANRYILDATEKEMERLGISAEMYHDGKKQVERMNEMGIEYEY